MRTLHGKILLIILLAIFIPFFIVKVNAATTCSQADITHDGIVDLSDYSLLVANFFKQDFNPQADTNADGIIDLTDYSAIVLFFFQNCSINPSPSPTPTQTPNVTSIPTAIPTVTPTTPPSQPTTMIGNCPVFPSDNLWNQNISQLPVHPNSAAYINSIGAGTTLHPDFGGASFGESYGIPFITVSNSQQMTNINFTAYGDESDPGPYPIPLNAPIEGGVNSDGDRHVLAVNTDTCKLYELYRAFPQANSWNADSGAIFDLRSNALRPKYWTSTDAAGLPVFAGLVRYSEVQSGQVTHAIRFTASRTQRGFISPARHFASSSTDPNLPPMGLRVRLKSSYDITHLTGQARIIAQAMKTYGLILADNGSNWFFQGDVNSSWNDDHLNQLKSIPGSAFEAVDTGPIEH